MIERFYSRRAFLTTSAGALGALSQGLPAFAALQKPSAPVMLNIVDVAGNLALTQKAIDNYRVAKPEWVSKITYSKAPAPELPGKLKAQQDAGRVDIDLVLTGTDVLSAGVEQKLWQSLLPRYAADLPKLADILLEPAARMQALAQNQGVIVTYYPSGPLFEYAPERLKSVPKTAADLLAWAKANPKRFVYASDLTDGEWGLISPCLPEPRRLGRPRSTDLRECVALHRHDGVPVADDAQEFSAVYNCAVLFLRVASDRVMGSDQPSSGDGGARTGRPRSLIVFVHSSRCPGCDEQLALVEHAALR